MKIHNLEWLTVSHSHSILFANQSGERVPVYGEIPPLRLYQRRFAKTDTCSPDWNNLIRNSTFISLFWAKNIKGIGEMERGISQCFTLQLNARLEGNLFPISQQSALRRKSLPSLGREFLLDLPTPYRERALVRSKWTVYEEKRWTSIEQWHI